MQGINCKKNLINYLNIRVLINPSITKLLLDWLMNKKIGILPRQCHLVWMGGVKLDKRGF